MRGFISGLAKLDHVVWSKNKNNRGEKDGTIRHGTGFAMVQFRERQTIAAPINTAFTCNGVKHD
jgi:hypothetical protein